MSNLRRFKACDLFELNGNQKYISDIQTDPFIFQEYLFPRGSGANFNKLPVTIIISLTPEQTRKYLEFEFTDKKTNIKDYIIKIYDNSNNIIKVLNETSSTNRIVILPRVVISESKIISKIEIVIISTTDRNPPIHVKISIKGFNSNGCESTTQFILTSSTTTPLSTSFITSSLMTTSLPISTPSIPTRSTSTPIIMTSPLTRSTPGTISSTSTTILSSTSTTILPETKTSSMFI